MRDAVRADALVGQDDSALLPSRTASSASARMRSMRVAQRASRRAAGDRRCSRSRRRVPPKCACMRANIAVESAPANRAAADVRLASRPRQDVAEIAEARLQPHHAPFAQAVDRRVGDLAEILAEEVDERRGTGRESTASGVSSPIEPIGFLGVLDHRLRGSAPDLPCVRPAATWRRRSSSRLERRGSARGAVEQVVEIDDVA